VPSERVSRRTLALLGGGAVGVRLLYLAAFGGDYKPRSDANHYQAIASAFANGDGISARFPFTYLHPTAFRPPLYPALLGAFYWVTGVHVGVGQLLNVALGATVVVLAATLGAHIAGRRGGVAAGIAVGVYPPILANDVVLLSEPLSLALLLAMILLLVRSRPAWAGAACGLLVLTRPSAQLLVVVVAVWLIWRAGWRAAVRFGVVSIAVVAPWVVRNWVLVGAPTIVTSNGFNLVSVYSAEAQATDGFANAVFDDRFTRINQDNRSEVELDDAYRQHALDAVRDDWTIPPRVLGHNMVNFFEFRPDKNESAEQDDGRNLTFRNVTLPFFYVVTAAGLVGLWRVRRRRGAELLLVQAGYFTAASLATIGVPRLRLPLDLAAAIGAGLLVAELISRRAPETREPEPDAGTGVPKSAAPRWSRRARILVTLATVVGVVFAAGGVAFARNRVEANAHSQLEQKLDRDRAAVQRLADVDAGSLVGGGAAPPKADYARAQAVADRLWLLSPRLAGGLRSETRDAARTLDEALFELKVLDLVTSGNRDPATPPAAALDASRATYDAEARPANPRLPDWDTISSNPAMRRAARDFERLKNRLGRP
jgi:4-amino-4-deoxy-L-arabinose transferase-like glycosyltransferase